MNTHKNPKPEDTIQKDIYMMHHYIKIINTNILKRLKVGQHRPRQQKSEQNLIQFTLIIPQTH